MKKVTNFLTTDERENLKAMHRNELERRTADRIKAVLLADNGWSYRQVAKALLLDEDTVNKHVNEYMKNKKLKIQTGGSESKLSNEQTKELIAHLEIKTYLKALEICDYVKKTYNIEYSVAGMTDWLKRNNFTFRKPHAFPAKADLEKQAAFVIEYERLKFQTPENEPIVFLDAVHPTMATKIAYGWIRKKSNKIIETTASRTRMNIVGAINLNKMQVDVKSYKTVDSETMIDYFKFLKTCYPDAEKIYVILDQGPYNKSKKTKEYAEKNCIILHFLPAYSPNLNPIERLWKVMNEHVRNNVYFPSAKKFKENILSFFNKTWNSISSSMKKRITDNFQIFTKPAFSV